MKTNGYRLKYQKISINYHIVVHKKYAFLFELIIH